MADKYFDKYKKITKDFLEDPEVAKKIIKYKKNKLSINQIMEKITKDKLNNIIKAYARYLKSQRGGAQQNKLSDSDYMRAVENVGENYDFADPGENDIRRALDEFELQLQQNAPRQNMHVPGGMTARDEEYHRVRLENRNQRNRQRSEARINMLRSLLFSMFMLLSALGLIVNSSFSDVLFDMNLLGQGITMAHDIGLLGTAQNVVLWDLFWTYFNNARIPGGFTGEDLIVQRQLARFISPFFPLPHLNRNRRNNEGDGRNVLLVNPLDLLGGKRRKRKTRKKRRKKKTKKRRRRKRKKTKRRRR